MRAISVRQPYASQIASGEKDEEYRSWRITPGPLLICASKRPVIDDLPTGVALARVDVIRIDELSDGFAWVLARARRVAPFPVRGSAAIYHVDDALVRLL